MKLSNCPFCGEDDIEVNTLNNHWLWICTSCGARTYGVTGNPTEEQATKDWNHRPFEAHAVEVLAKELQKKYVNMMSLGYIHKGDLDMETMRAEARELLGIKEGE